MKNLNDPKYREYSERYGFWQNLSLNQLSFSNNLFLVAAFTSIGFIYKQMPQSGIYYTGICNSDKNLTLIVVAVILFSISIFSGFSCVLTRIADIRITRNIILTRKRFYSHYSDKKISSETFDNGYLTTKNRDGGMFICVLFGPQKIFIQTEEIPKGKKNDCIKQLKRQINFKLENLNYWENRMGKYSWKFHHWQIISFFIAFASFVFSIFDYP